MLYEMKLFPTLHSNITTHYFHRHSEQHIDLLSHKHQTVMLRKATYLHQGFKGMVAQRWEEQWELMAIRRWSKNRINTNFCAKICAGAFFIFIINLPLNCPIPSDICVSSPYQVPATTCSPPTSPYHLRVSTCKGWTDKLAVFYRFLPPLCASISLLLHSLTSISIFYPFPLSFSHNSSTALCFLHPDYPSFQAADSSSFLLQSYIQDRILLLFLFYILYFIFLCFIPLLF